MTAAMIVFLHIPKTAGSTFQFILENSFGLSACHTNHNKRKTFRQDDLNFAQKIFPGLKSIAGHNLINPLQLSAPNAFFMTFLREPIARVISQYSDSVTIANNHLSFEESLRNLDNYENVHVKLMVGESNLDKAKKFLERCDFVGLTEKFETSLHALQKICPYPLNLNYKKRRVTPPTDIKDKIKNDSRLMDMARECNKLDLKLYEFAVNEIFPKICAKARLDPSEKVNSFEHYTSELHPKFLLCNFYNMIIYRQLCKMRSQ